MIRKQENAMETPTEYSWVTLWHVASGIEEMLKDDRFWDAHAGDRVGFCLSECPEWWGTPEGELPQGCEMLAVCISLDGLTPNLDAYEFKCDSRTGRAWIIPADVLNVRGVPYMARMVPLDPARSRVAETVGAQGT